VTSDPRPTESGERRRPVQFTVRTFFAAMVLVSLFGAAAAIPGYEFRVCVIAFLVWLTFAGLYRTLRSTTLFAALVVAPMVVAISWLLSLSTLASTRLQAEVWMMVPFALEWAVLVSLLLALTSGLGGLAGRLRGNRFRALGASLLTSPAPADALPAWKVAAGLVAMRLAVAGVLIPVDVLVSFRFVDTVFVLCLGVDAPLAPLLLILSYPLRTSTDFLLLATALSCPVYALTGWLIAVAAGRWSRRRRRPP